MSAYSIFSKVKLPNGEFYPVYISALSKFMRRCMLNEAFYCANQLYLSGFQETEVGEKDRWLINKKIQKNFRTRTVNRITVALLEDNTPSCAWVIIQLEHLSSIIRNSYNNNEIDYQVIHLLWEIMSKICNGSKSRLMQHIRELGVDSLVVSIESIKNTKKQMLLYESFNINNPEYPIWADKIYKAAKNIFKEEKKPIVLVAAIIMIKYSKYCDNVPLSYWDKFEISGVIDIELNKPDLSKYPWIFDKHVHRSLIPKNLSSNLCPKGWKNFIDNEEAECSMRESDIISNDILCQELKKKYAIVRISQD